MDTLANNHQQWIRGKVYGKSQFDNNWKIFPLWSAMEWSSGCITATTEGQGYYRQSSPLDVEELQRQLSYGIKNQHGLVGSLDARAGSLWHKSAGFSNIMNLSINESKTSLDLDQ